MKVYILTSCLIHKVDCLLESYLMHGEKWTAVAKRVAKQSGVVVSASDCRSHFEKYLPDSSLTLLPPQAAQDEPVHITECAIDVINQQDLRMCEDVRWTIQQV